MFKVFCIIGLLINIIVKYLDLLIIGWDSIIGNDRRWSVLWMIWNFLKDEGIKI